MSIPSTIEVFEVTMVHCACYSNACLYNVMPLGMCTVMCVHIEGSLKVTVIIIPLFIVGFQEEEVPVNLVLSRYSLK